MATLSPADEAESGNRSARAGLLYQTEAIPVVDPPDDDPPVAADEHSLLGLAELLLKAPAQVDRLTRDADRQPELIFRFLAIALASFSLFAIVLILLLNWVSEAALPEVLAQHWKAGVGSAVSLWLAYAVGLVAASGVCLPSFYFFGLLAGVRASWLQVTAHVLRGKGATAVLLLGLLPIYVAVVLGMVVFQASDAALRPALWVGLALPFLAGLWGVHTIYRGFLGLADSLPPEQRCRRTCFLRRLTVSWAAVYSVVSPVMIYRLWEILSEWLA
jgi:hypothetical protein